MDWHLKELASLLDETIAKGRFQGKSKIEAKEEEILKSLSHDPFNPKTVNSESNYYNPYRSLPEGGFLPHPAKYWEDQGKNIDDYQDTERFYARYLTAKKSLAALVDDVEDLFKAEPVAPGTEHKHRGRKYVKHKDGNWHPKAGPAHEELEKNAPAAMKVKEHLDKHKKEQDLVARASKELLKEIKAMLVGKDASELADLLSSKGDK